MKYLSSISSDNCDVTFVDGTFTGDLTVDTNTLYVDSTNNRVGIGTTSPARNLHIHQDDSTLSYIQITNSTTGTSGSDGVSFGITSDEVAIWNNRENTATAISTNNAERMRITSGGNVLIGTTTDSGYKLQVSGDVEVSDSQADVLIKSTTAGQASRLVLNTTTREWRIGTHSGQNNSLWIYDATAASYRLALDTSGNLGVGTTSPSHKLHVNGGNIFGSSNVLASNNVYAAGPQGFVFGSSTSEGEYIYRSGNDIIMRAGSSDVLTVDGDNSRVGIGTTSPSSLLQVQSGVGNTQLDGHQILLSRAGNNHIFATSASGVLALGTNNAEKMRITSSGNVGIGTTNPTSKTHVYYGGGTTNGLHVQASANRGKIAVSDNDTAAYMIAENSLASFGRQDALSANNLNITSGGNVLIGTTTDNGYKLAVSGGDAQINGVNVGKGGGSVAQNTIVGYGALTSTTTGNYNTALGYQAGYSNTTGERNTAVGRQALRANSTGSYNVALGMDALNNNTASNNTALGYQAAYSNTSGNIVAIGWQAGFANTTGTITAVGYQALKANTTGSENVAVGRESMRLATASNNTAVGTYSGYVLTTGSGNTMVGRRSLFTATTANYNTALGYQALKNNATSSSNTAVGLNSLVNTTGNSNTAIGTYAGDANTTGSNNIFIGNDSDGVSVTDSNRTFIGNSSTTSTWVGGNLLVGTTTDAGATVHIRQSSSGQSPINSPSLFIENNGSSNSYYALQVATQGGGYSLNVTNAGRVGINTTSPSTQLHVKGTNEILRIEDSSSTGNPYISFYQNGTRRSFVQHVDGDDTLSLASEYGDFRVMTGTSGTEVERMRIKSGGNVLIGTTSDAGYKLRVDGSALFTNWVRVNGSDGIYFQDRGGGWRMTDTTWLRSYNDKSIYTGGGAYFGSNVGIGTSSPNHKLDIYSNENVPLRIHRPSNANLNSSGAWGIGFSTRGDANTSTSDTRAGIFSYYNGNLFIATSTSDVVADPDASARLTVTSAGAVGIGTMSPETLLHLESTSSGSSPILTVENDNDIKLKLGSVRSLAGTAPDTTFIAYDSSLRFIADADSTTEVARINSNGNVLIGTTSDGGQKLQVNGMARFDSTVYVGEYITHLGDGDTALRFLDDSIQFNAGGVAMMKLTEGSADTVTINPDSADVNFQVNGDTVANLLFVDAGTSNVGIGTSSPTARLEVIGTIKQKTGSGYANYVQQSVSEAQITFSTYSNNQTNHPSAIKFSPNGTEAVRIDNDGNLGVGTASPYGKLNVIPSSNPTTATDANQITVGESSSNSQYNLRIGYFLSGGAYKGSIQAISGNTPNTLVLNGDGGSVGIGTYSPSEKLEVAGNIGIDGYIHHNGDDSKIGFEGNDAIRIYTANSVAMQIDSSQRVGIGTTSPSQKLHVVGNVRIDDGYTLGWGADTTKIAGNSSANTLAFKTSSANRLYINSSGNVGINTTSPSSKLHVVGDFFLKGSDTSSSTKNFQVQTGNGTSIMDFRNDAYAFFGCGQGGGSASGFIFRYNSTFGVQFTGYNYGNGTSPSYKPILMDTDLAGRSQGVYVNYGITGYTAPAPTTTAEFAVRGRGTSSSFTAKFEDSATNPLLYIKDNGNVMIGTGTDSGYKLDVEGNTNTNGDYYVNGTQGWSGTININTNPPVAITVEGGIITNVT